jgi:DNA-binding MurR/RpiR family transcriptional regulator
MAKAVQIKDYIDNNPNLTIKTKDLAANCNVSLPTVLKFIKDNPERFEKTSYGEYKIIPVSSTEQSYAPPVIQPANTVPLLQQNQFEW